MKQAFTILIFILVLGCKDKPAAVPASQPTQENKAENKFFPVLDFIRNEIALVDSTPVGIMHYSDLDGKRDSGYIKNDEFHRLASNFISDELSADMFQKKFRENAFFDRSTNTANFVYSALDTSTALRRIDVITREDAAYERVTSIYMEKMENDGEAIVTKKMMWKPGQQFVMNSEVRLPGKNPSLRQNKVVWNNWKADQ